LQERVGRRPHLRMRRRRPMAEREEADVFHRGMDPLASKSAFGQKLIWD
jgi:hypothetical protein